MKRPPSVPIMGQDSQQRKNELLHILQHALGRDVYGRGTDYRNHYCAGPGHHSFDLCREAVAAGLMPPTLTRGQKRYRAWLEVADVVGPFGEWLKAGGTK